jgi:ABC-2 type transport system ATP-binding protein
VFGRDPVKHPVEVLQRIGYLSEERELPEWMRIDELMRYTQAFHPNWDAAYGHELLNTFQLDGRKKIKELSKGMRAQAGLIVAVAHRPELLLLDEPSTGLDAVVRRDILNAIVRTVADDGRTVVFSSHLLDEVEQMSDHVVMIDHGEIVLRGGLDDIKEQHHRLGLRFPDDRDQLPRVSGILAAERMGREWDIVCNGEVNRIREVLQTAGGELVRTKHASLQEIFVARVGRHRIPASEE